MNVEDTLVAILDGGYSEWRNNQPVAWVELFYSPKFAWLPVLTYKSAPHPELIRWPSDLKTRWLVFYLRRKYVTHGGSTRYCNVRYEGVNGLGCAIRRQWNRLRHTWA